MRVISSQDAPSELVRFVKEKVHADGGFVLEYVEDYPYYAVHVQFHEGCAVLMLQELFGKYIVLRGADRQDKQLQYIDLVHGTMGVGDDLKGL